MLPVSLLSLPGTLRSSLLDCKLHEGRNLSSLASPPYFSIYQVHYLTTVGTSCTMWSDELTLFSVITTNQLWARERARTCWGSSDSGGVSPPAPGGGHLLDEHISLAFSKVLHGSIDKSPSPKASK